MLTKYKDVFRVGLGNCPPAKVEPMCVDLKPALVPFRAKARRYPSTQKAFRERFVDRLLEYGFIKPNPDAMWAAAPLIVPKLTSVNFRLTLISCELIQLPSRLCGQCRILSPSFSIWGIEPSMQSCIYALLTGSFRLQKTANICTVLSLHLVLINLQL